MQNKSPRKYSKCDHVPLFEPEEVYGTEESLGSSVLPLFGPGMHDRAFQNQQSMATNERLRCRWREYVQSCERRQFLPFQLPDDRELHFHNSAIRFLPRESIKYKDHRFKLKPGPGIDNLGQMLIPQEAFMKRVTAVKTDRRNKMAEKAAGK